MTSSFTRATMSASAGGLACARRWEGNSAANNANALNVKAAPRPKVKTDARLGLFIVCARFILRLSDCSWNLGFGRISRGLHAAIACRSEVYNPGQFLDCLCALIKK